MNSVIRDVRDIDSSDRQALEHVLGQPLRDDQRVVIQVEPVPASSVVQENGDGKPQEAKLPAWCNVYEGLSDDEIADVERIALSRADMTRASE